MTVKFARIVHDRAGDFGLQLESAEVHQVLSLRPLVDRVQLCVQQALYECPGSLYATTIGVGCVVAVYKSSNQNDVDHVFECPPPLPSRAVSWVVHPTRCCHGRIPTGFQWCN
jgi:hypothetical protein